MEKIEPTSVPYSENIIFFDTEFTNLDPRTGELLSIGMIKPSGEELYLEFEHTGPLDPWVEEHVVPYLEGITFSKVEACKLIRQFMGDTHPYLVSYVNQFDAVYWYDLFDSAQEHPAFWIPIDFASVLFAYGFAPNAMGNHKFIKSLGISTDITHKEHNALDDARLLKKIYYAFFEWYGRGGERVQ